jgi:heme exporter protein A
MNLTLSAVDLSCIRGGREVFCRLGFEVAAGEALAITGRNGAGKSSLLRILAGLLQAAKGQITLRGDDQSERSLAEQAHYLGHRDALKPNLTVAENLAFWRDFLGDISTGRGTDLAESRGMESHVESLAQNLAATGLAHTAALPAATLSAGQRRRLSLARLIAVKRPVWLLDEPTSALDADGQTMFAGLMSAHLAEGGIIIAATHEPLKIAPARPTTASVAAVRTLQIGLAA